LKKSDLPPKNQETAVIHAVVGKAPAFLHPIFTSGIAYADIGFDCSCVDASLLPYLPLYVELAGRCGAAGISYENMSKRAALAVGGINGSLLCEMDGSNGALIFKYFLHGKSLTQRVGDMAGIFSDLLLSPELNNAKQIQDVLFEMRNDLNASVIHSGHSFAATHAASRLVPSKFIDEALDGVTQLRFLDMLAKEFDADAVIEKMQSLHRLLINVSRCTVSITADDPNPVAASMEVMVSGLPAFDVTPAVLPFEKRPGPARGIEISSSVNFVAKAWHCEDFSPEAIGRFYVLSKNLSADYLWNKVRVEGGAYGGMAMLSAGHPVFTCTSYRDPNLSSTLGHFEAGLRSISGIDAAAVDQSIIATIGRIDAPRTPHEKGLGETIALLCGRSKELRQRVREAVLGTSPHRLSESAQRLLDEKETAITILGSSSAFDKAEKEGLEVRREKLL
jgi:Zn-dependent M16 (insulinase) family peptidase